MKFLLVALMCVVAVTAYSETDLEYALFEDAGILETIKERIKQGFEAVLERIKGLIEQHKPIIENLKEKIAALKDRVRDLLSQTGDKFREAVSNLRQKIQALLQEVIKKIKDGTEDKVEDALYEDEPTTFELLVQKIRERVQAAFQRLGELIAKHKETLTAALKEKIEQVKQKLVELAKEHGAKFLDKAREIATKIREVIQQVLGKIGQKEESALYAIEEEGETFLQALKRRIVERLQKAVEQIKEKLSQVKSEFAEKVLPKLQEIRDKIKELATQSGEKLLETAGKISQKIREIVNEVKNQILGEAGYYLDIKEAARTLRDFFTSPAGIQALKDNARTANPATQTGQLVKAFILAATPEALKELIQELFKNVGYSAGQYQDIKELVQKASAWLQTDEGVAAIRAYAQGLETSHPVVLRLKALLAGASNAEVKELFQDIFTIN